MSLEINANVDDSQRWINLLLNDTFPTVPAARYSSEQQWLKTYQQHLSTEVHSVNMAPNPRPQSIQPWQKTVTKSSECFFLRITKAG